MFIYKAATCIVFILNNMFHSYNCVYHVISGLFISNIHSLLSADPV